MSAGQPGSPTLETTPSHNYLHILEKLVAEADIKCTVFTEEVSKTFYLFCGETQTWLSQIHGYKAVKSKTIDLEGHSLCCIPKKSCWISILNALFKIIFSDL